MKKAKELLELVGEAESSEQEYAKRFKEIGVLLKSVEKKVGEHQKKFNKDKKNWGFTGDLGHVVASLKDVDKFMG